MDNTSKATNQTKLDMLKDPVVIQIVFDALHKRRTKYSAADNSGQHVDYKDMVEEMRKDYEKQVNK